MQFMRKYTILTPDQIAEARRLASEGVPQSKLCEIFGASSPTIHHHLFSDGPILRRCEFCNDEFPISGRAKYCDTDCRAKATAKAQTKHEWRITARREATAALIKQHPNDFQVLFDFFLDVHRPDGK